MPVLVVAAASLAASFGLWWQVWTGHPTSTFLCACGDPGQYLWFFAAPADALRHGHLPLFTSADYHPGGVNMMDNPGVLGLAIAVAPVTWVFGPVAAVNLTLLVTPVLSAVCAFVTLRRWVRWWPAAALASGFYAFSPFVVSGLQYVHLQAVFLALPPLVLLCLDELLVRQRRRPVPVGVALGVVVAAQYLVSPEMVVLTALAAAVGVVLLLAYAAVRLPGEIRRRAPWAVRGVGAGIGTALVLAGYPVWFALDGPRHTVGAPWAFIAETGNNVKDFFVPGAAAGRQALDPILFGYYGDPGPAGDYLGATLVAASVATVVVLRRHRLVLWAAAVALVLAALSLGIVFITSATSLVVHPHQAHHTDWWLPWNLLAHLPLVDEASPSRLSGIIDLFVAMVAAVGLDHVVMALRRHLADAGPGPGPVPAAPAADRSGRLPHKVGGRWWRAAAPAAAGLGLAAAALVPIGLAYHVPLTTKTAKPPRWFETAANRLPAGSVVLALPWGLSQTSAWQAIDGMRFVMAGGDAFVPGPHGRVLQHPPEHTADAYLTDLSTFAAKPEPTPAVERTMRRALRRWHVTTVVVSTGIGPPAYAVGFFAAVLGTAPTVEDGAWVWNGVDRAPPAWAEPGEAIVQCSPTTASPMAVVQCLAALSLVDSSAHRSAT